MSCVDNSVLAVCVRCDALDLPHDVKVLCLADYLFQVLIDIALHDKAVPMLVQRDYYLLRGAFGYKVKKGVGVNHDGLLFRKIFLLFFHFFDLSKRSPLLSQGYLFLLCRLVS
jgi:hypothetical protein